MSGVLPDSVKIPVNGYGFIILRKGNIMRKRTMVLLTGFACTLLLVSVSSGAAGKKALDNTVKQSDGKYGDYLWYVRTYADTLLNHGRDTYGKIHSPLIASVLNRETLRLFAGDELDRIKHLPRKETGLRQEDRMLTGGNPMQDQNLYQILYALTEVTGNKRYAEEADKTLKWFFQHCQSQTTGLLVWGEHMGWDFNTEKLLRKYLERGWDYELLDYIHEFSRPWVLWERSFDLAPQACLKFAHGLWDHQIGDHETGNFSRHARYDRHKPGLNLEFPRHGGFYIPTWAEAYERTKDPVFLKAIETLVTYFDTRRSPISGAIPFESHERSKNARTTSTDSSLSLAVDLWDGAAKVPEPLAAKMRACASRTDEVFLKCKHDLSMPITQAKGFMLSIGLDTLVTLKPEYRDWATSDMWRGGYGNATDAGVANICLLRYRQVNLDGYKKLVLDAAKRHLNSEPDIANFFVQPGTVGNVILLMLGAHELTGEQQYLDRANFFAQLAIELFFDETSSLPKATSRHSQYESGTRADTLMMAMLQLWVREHRPELKLHLVPNDR